MITLFEQYQSSSYIDVDLINKLIKDKSVMNKIQNILNAVPNNIKEFLKKDRIDVSKLIRIEKRFNIFKRVFSLYEKGIRNVKDIINKIIPKNESFTLIGLLIIVSIIAVSIASLAGVNYIITHHNPTPLGIGLVILLALSAITSIIGGSEVYLKQKEKYKQIELLKTIPKEKKIEDLSKNVKKVILDSGLKTDTVMFYIDEKGDYKVKIMTDDTEW